MSGNFLFFYCSGRPLCFYTRFVPPLFILLTAEWVAVLYLSVRSHSGFNLLHTKALLQQSTLPYVLKIYNKSTINSVIMFTLDEELYKSRYDKKFFSTVRHSSPQIKEKYTSLEPESFPTVANGKPTWICSKPWAWGLRIERQNKKVRIENRD